MTFKPGESGNPGGRPKGLHRAADLARAHTEAAIGILVEIMHDETAPPTARAAAASHVLDRAWGKATQPVDMTAGGPEGLSDEELAMLQAFVESQLGLDEGEATDSAVH
jgi:hypothetical protein